MQTKTLLGFLGSEHGSGGREKDFLFRVLLTVRSEGHEAAVVSSRQAPTAALIVCCGHCTGCRLLLNCAGRMCWLRAPLRLGPCKAECGHSPQNLHSRHTQRVCAGQGQRAGSLWKGLPVTGGEAAPHSTASWFWVQISASV